MYILPPGQLNTKKKQSATPNKNILFDVAVTAPQFKTVYNIGLQSHTNFNIPSASPSYKKKINKNGEPNFKRLTKHPPNHIVTSHLK